MKFIKSTNRFLENTSAIPTSILSKDIKDEINKAIGYIPENAYISNSAPDYFFITIVDEEDVYTYTDSYCFYAELKDRKQLLVDDYILEQHHYDANNDAEEE